MGTFMPCHGIPDFLSMTPHNQHFVQIKEDAKGRSLLNLEINTLSQQGDFLIMSIQNGDLKKYELLQNRYFLNPSY